MYSCRRFLRTKADVFHPGFRKKIRSDKTEGKAQAGESGGGEREAGTKPTDSPDISCSGMFLSRHLDRVSLVRQVRN